ncbi:hypothetical protein LX32DRAFT_733953 [Colletotrichum zoysiae]|uniref:Uncharacterized protein n=1 Tax=Colletotrichum zoysiae TaxID=1216348 RepID=A0AAD9LW65_9PEZI|nr:hypothetical protein LX32DRAFT_733953 [Colletotrichum zoysiae]
MGSWDARENRRNPSSKTYRGGYWVDIRTSPDATVDWLSGRASRARASDRNRRMRRPSFTLKYPQPCGTASSGVLECLRIGLAGGVVLLQWALGEISGRPFGAVLEHEFSLKWEKTTSGRSSSLFLPPQLPSEPMQFLAG